jgi:O-antigen/teichoic acid export membrane protein
MTAGARALGMRQLTRRAFSLGMVRSVDNALQFLLPLVLVRCLDEASFGEYRLIGLVLGTVITLAPLNMDSGLFAILPKLDRAMKRLYVHQTMLFLACTGLLSAWLASPWSPLSPETLAPLARHGVAIPALVFLWVATRLLDVLPSVDERIAWQAAASVSIAALRAGVVGVGAWFTHDIELVVWLMLAVAVLKLALMLVYVQRQHGLGRRWFDAARFGDQARHVMPLGLASTLFGLRAQADQWVAAALFALTSFSAFSIAAVVGPLVNVFRHSVMEAFLPSMTRLQGAGDVRGMVEMNGRANLLVATVMLPLLAFTFAFAEPIIEVLYTPAYLEAAPVMRVYLLGLALAVIEVHSVVLILRQGAFAIAVNCLMLAVSVLASLAMASRFGLAGAAAGSVFAFYIDRALTLRRIARTTGVPFRKLQRWGGLALALGYAALVAGLAFACARLGLARLPPLGQLVAGGTVLAIGYLLVLRLPALRRGLG